MNAMQRLNEVVKRKGPLIAGLDPDFETVYQLCEKACRGIYRNKDYFVMQHFCYNYLESIREHVGIVKINSAFFEANSMQQLYMLVAEQAKSKGFYVIGDVKRADIGSSSEQYAKAFLSADSPFDAITINPYLGTDGVKPFLDYAKKNDKGVFVLVKTSNPSSDELQNAILSGGQPFYEKVAELVERWGKYTTGDHEEDYTLVGAVVGATHPREAKRLRELLPHTFFLVPGYGAQGATANDIVVNFDKYGGGAAVNSSRGIMYAYKNSRWKDMYTKEQWAEATTAEAERAQKELADAIVQQLT